jgi:hypothetical protein
MAIKAIPFQPTEHGHEVLQITWRKTIFSWHKLFDVLCSNSLEGPFTSLLHNRALLA